MGSKKFEPREFSRNALIIITVSFFAALWILFSTIPRYEINLKFENVSMGNFSNILDKKYVAIKNYNDWVNLWNKMNFNVIGIAQPPFVDFNKSMIIAVYEGQHTSSGYAIEITKIVESNYYYEVFVQEEAPGMGCISNIFTQPYHIVKVNYTEKDVTFSNLKEIINCV